MHDIVAIAVRLEDGRKRFFLTHGRAFDPVDGAELERVVLACSARHAPDGTAVAAEVAYSLQDAAGEPHLVDAMVLCCRFIVSSCAMPIIVHYHRVTCTPHRRFMRMQVEPAR